VTDSEQTPITASETVAVAELPRSRVGKLRWWIHLILIGGYFVPSIFLTGPRAHPALTYTSRGLLFVCALQIAAFALVFGLGWLSSRATTDELLLRWQPKRWLILLGIGYSVAIRIGVAIVAIVVSAVLLATVFDQRQLTEFWRSGEPNIREIVSVATARSDPVYIWLLLTVVSFVVAGLREELWRAGTLAAMRALWPRAFGSRFGEVIAVLLIAVEFGAGHVRLGVFAAVAAGLLGIFLGLIMLAHRSIWPAVIAHGFFDATSFALLAWLPMNLQHQ
jgi:membrane protease YdiL (CAAX protease family)